MQIPIPKSFVSFLSLSSTLPHSEDTSLPFLEIQSLLPVLRRCCVEVVPCADVFFMYLSEERWSSIATAAKLLQSCLTLCDPIDSSLPGYSVPRTLQARTLECVAMSFSDAWKWKVKVKNESEVTHSCLTLRDPMDCSLPGSSVHGIFQAWVLEWVAIAFSIISFQIFFFIVDEHFHDFKW